MHALLTLTSALNALGARLVQGFLEMLSARAWSGCTDEPATLRRGAVVAGSSILAYSQDSSDPRSRRFACRECRRRRQLAGSRAVSAAAVSFTLLIALFAAVIAAIAAWPDPRGSVRPL